MKANSKIVFIVPGTFVLISCAGVPDSPAWFLQQNSGGGRLYGYGKMTGRDAGSAKIDELEIIIGK
jgi:hypothetical protein